MNIKPIRSDDDLQAAFKRLEVIFQAEPGTPEADEMEVLVTLIEVYENKHYPIQAADPIEAIKFCMDQQGLTARDLERYIGPSGRVSEVLNGKRGLSLSMTNTTNKSRAIFALRQGVATSRSPATARSDNAA
ncbi:helix-turn-helix domain-containing protein [Pseudomonas sp. CAM1A]|uniref:helix-turn-helix domain-containing protein n=1 Tax=Pseudomonas sp. CAM1A TaxID=3231717 RepID=UPI0039C607B9